MEIRRSFPPASARIWNSSSEARRQLVVGLKVFEQEDAMGLPALPASLLLPLQDIFIKTLPLKKLKPSWVPGACLEVRLYGAVRWCPGDTAECCRAVITQGVQDEHPPASSMLRAKHRNWRGQYVTGRLKINCFR